MIELLAAAIFLNPEITPMPAQEREVTFPGKDITLHGTYTLPEGKIKGAVLLLPGSGPTDRDGNQPPSIITNVLKDLSAAIVDAGYATLRFDKRPVHTNRDQWPKDINKFNDYFSWDNHAYDVEAAFAFLKSQKEVKGKRAFVLGHSEGSMLALFTAPKTKADGLLLLGSPGRTMDKILIDQVDASIDRANISQEQKDDLKKEHRRIVATVKAKAEVPENVPVGLTALYNKTSIRLVHEYMNLDPKSEALAYSGPVLIANGQFDVQISAEKDAKVLYGFFKERPHGDQTLLIVPGASHNFKHVDDPKKDAGFTGPLASGLVEGVLKFLNAHV